MRPSLPLPAAAVLLLALAACDIARPPEDEPSKDFQSAVNPVASAREQAQADAALSQEVKRALVESVGVQPEKVEVVAADGVVTLEGQVEKPEVRERAALFALSQEGVRSVVNNLVVSRGS